MIIQGTSFIVAMIFLLFVTAISAQAAKRVALVIGNGDYQTLADLNNPVPDTKALAKLLRKHGFEVMERYNLKRGEFLDVLEEFRELAAGAREAVVFYGGHGMGLEGRDVLAPVDMSYDCTKKRYRCAVGMDKLRETLRGVPKQVVILDSCRNQPFPKCKKRGRNMSGGFRSLGRLGSGTGTLLIANATLLSKLTDDGFPGKHSPFAGALLKRLKSSPRTYFRDLLDDVAADVRQATNGNQIPEIKAQGGAPKICLAAGRCDSGDDVMRNQITMLKQKLQKANRNKRKKVEQKLAVGVFPKPLEQFRKRLPFEPEVVLIPGGTFSMGCVSGRDCQDNEMPVHRVTVRSFYMSKYETTHNQFRAFVRNTGYKVDLCYWGEDLSWHDLILKQHGNHPVACVSWKDAIAYAKWLSQKTTQIWRLPREAEWEYAARGDGSGNSQTKYSWGNLIECKNANYDGGRGSSCDLTVSDSIGSGRVTRVVGSYAANKFGLHDMIGNVSEWVHDFFDDYTTEQQVNPKGPSSGLFSRVVRGGSRTTGKRKMGAAQRSSIVQSTRTVWIGFRLVREP